MDSVQVFILAAGSSSRMGNPKQLIKIKGNYLLNQTIGIVLSTGLKNVSVVLGANAEEISKVINLQSIEIFMNYNWSEGMSSSFRTAMDNISSDEIKAALFILCDQPLLSKSLLSNLLDNYLESSDDIISCNYGRAFGPPSLFPRCYFDEIKKLKGDKGAKSIILKHVEKLIKIDFKGGTIDMDTQKDLNKFLNQKKDSC